MRASLSEDRNKTGTGPVENASAEDAMDAVAAAESAMGGWKTVSPRGARGEILRRAYELMIQRKTWLARLISLENGKALPDAEGEVLYAAEFLRWFSEEAVRLNGEYNISPSGATRIIVTHRPIGVTVLVTP